MLKPLSVGEIVLAIQSLVHEPVSAINASHVKDKSEMLRRQLELLAHSPVAPNLSPKLRKACLSLSMAADLCMFCGEINVSNALEALGESV